MIKKKLKHIGLVALIALLCAASATAEIYHGTTVATAQIQVVSSASAQLDSVNILPGSSVRAGDVLFTLRGARVFADQDGVIARIHAEEGDDVDGDVLELQPISRYEIYCSVEKAYASAQTMLIHSGETLYLRCTANGSHQGTAIVTSIDGEQYMAEATGGEFYNGETVYLYRDASFSDSSRVGVGTVVAAQAQSYSADGKLLKMHVSQGEYVERGELLYEIIDGGSTEILSPTDGIITQCLLTAGERVQQGENVCAIVAPENIAVSVQLEAQTAAKLQVGDSVALSYSADDQESLTPGVICEISQLGEEDYFTILIQPDTPPAYIGMSVEARID